MKFNCILLVVSDLIVSRELYEDILGLTLDMDLGENISYKEGIALHEKGHFQSLIDKSVSLTQSNCYELYFEEDEIEAIYQVICDKYELVHELRHQPWHQHL